MAPLPSQGSGLQSGFHFARTTEQILARAGQRRVWPKTVLRVALSLLAFLGCLSPNGDAQSYVFNDASFPTGLRPSWVMTGDFNRDGIVDIATVNQCGTDPMCLTAGSVSILLGKPLTGTANWTWPPLLGPN